MPGSHLYPLPYTSDLPTYLEWKMSADPGIDRLRVLAGLDIPLGRCVRPSALLANRGRPEMTEARPTHKIELERVHFKQLLASNPNYFGNLADSPYKPVKTIIGNTTYEELTCVGYNPDLRQLEATIQIHLPGGYNGGLCAAGSIEYVRFFVDYGGGWIDQGVVGINVHDIPNSVDCAKQADKPLTYVLSRKIEPSSDVCKRPTLPKVRAILSWQVVPQAGNPAWPPVWGNVQDRHIQIKPYQKNVFALIDILATQIGKQVILPPQYEEIKFYPIPLPDPPPLQLADLAKLYSAGQAATAAKTTVEPHRFGLTDIHSTITSAAFDQGAVLTKAADWKAIGLDWSGAVAALGNVHADVSYEEVECLGLDNNLEWLAATFRIKRPTGYSGDLCQPGSQEYIAFWADWDNTCVWTYLGTVAVNVHDFKTIPPEGLAYTALLPVDLKLHRQPCEQGPKIGRVRAVLSWAVSPSTTDPEALTTWGNRIDAHVQINPGPHIVTPTPIIGVLGGIPISKIDPFTGLSTFDAYFALNGFPPDALGRPCPFAGRVVLQGPEFPGLKYRVQVHKVGDPGPWQTVTTTITLVDWTGTVFTTQAADSNGFFSFVPFTQNIDHVLAWWDTIGDDLWEIRLELATPGDVLLPGMATHVIQLKNSGVADVRVHIDSGGDCKTFTKGAHLDGHYVVRDPYLGSYSLGTLPFAAPIGQLVPVSGNVQTAPAPMVPTAPPPGGATWTLDTTGMEPCGYVLLLTAVDRAIINSVSVGHYRSASVGFCVVK